MRVLNIGQKIDLFPRNPLLHIQLSLMMFLQFFVMGCTLPIMSLYMNDYLHFSGIQTGSVLALSAAFSFFSPIISTFIADRVISAERFLSLVHLFSAVLIFYLSSQTTYLSFLIIYIVYTAVLNPSGALTSAICFHHLSDRNHFGDIRLWGTIGWIAAAWVFGIVVSSKKIFFLSNDLHSALLLSMIASIVLAVYALFLPKGISHFQKSNDKFPKDSLKIACDPTFIILCLFSGVINLIDRFYVFGAAPYLKTIGYAEKDILPILSIGQIPEIFVLLVLGVFLKRFGFKRIVIAGIAFELFRFSIFAVKVNDLFLFSGILVHGMTYVLCFVPITILIDKKCLPHARAGAQQLYSFFSGTGLIAGNFIAGICADLTKTSPQSTINYSRFWLIAMILSGITLLSFLMFFKEPKQSVTDENLKKEEADIDSNILKNSLSE